MGTLYKCTKTLRMNYSGLSGMNHRVFTKGEEYYGNTIDPRGINFTNDLGDWHLITDEYLREHFIKLE